MRFLLLFLISCSWALNSTHFSHYTLYPELARPGRSEVQSGIQSSFSGPFTLPLAFIFPLGQKVESGVRLNFQSPNEEFAVNDLLLQLDLGFSIRLTKISAFDVDILLGIGKDQPAGAMVGYSLYHGVTSKFSVLYQLRAGFLEGLADDEFAVTEALMFHRIQLFQPLHILANLSYSSSITSPIKYSAFDIGPGLEFDLSGPARIFFIANMGIKGARMENDILWELGMRYAI